MLTIAHITHGTESLSPDVISATVGGTYSHLLRTINVPEDEQRYGKFHHYGYYAEPNYAGYSDLPAGYWVYVAPHWYIWKEHQQASSQSVDAAAFPEDARQLLEEFEQVASTIRNKAELEINARKQELIERLQKVQDAYTTPGTLDQAVAVRDRIRALQADLRNTMADVQPAPDTLQAYAGAIGQAFYFRVIGRTIGAIWGTDLYTMDSDLGTAVVHAGALHNGQEGIVKVVILPGAESYPGSVRHGVSSDSWGNWTGSYRLEVVK
jgi:hypothetical protein